MTQDPNNIPTPRLDKELDGLFVIMKRGLYYRPNAKGYTDNIHEAWMVTEEIAKEHEYPHDEPVTIHSVASIREKHSCELCKICQLERELTIAQQEIARLKEDKERLDWLTEHANFSVDFFDGLPVISVGAPSIPSLYLPLREAIDKARRDK